MANTKLLQLSDLSIVKDYVDQEAAKAYRSASYTVGTRTINFFKTTDGTGDPAFSVTLPADVDISGLIPKVDNATANNVAILNADGTIADSGVAYTALTKDADLAAVAKSGNASDVAIADAEGVITATTVEGALTEIAKNIDVIEGTGAGSFAKAIDDKIDSLDYTDSAVAHEFVTAVSEADGVISVSRAALTADDIPTLTLSKISDAGEAAKKAVATSVSENNGNLVAAMHVKTYVDDAIKAVSQFKYEVVSTLPDASAETYGKIYLVADSHATGDIYDEYITIDNGDSATPRYTWEKIGNTDIDLTGYVQKTTTIAGVDLQNDITKDTLLTALNIEDGAQVNKLETVKVNKNAVAINAKAIDITIEEGTANGTVAVMGSDVAVKGLDSAAYQPESHFMLAADYEMATEAEVKGIFGLA